MLADYRYGSDVEYRRHVQRNNKAGMFEIPSPRIELFRGRFII
jgi:hypothetical protein